jgi:hypothetical protein
MGTLDLAEFGDEPSATTSLKGDLRGYSLYQGLCPFGHRQ